LRASPGVVHLFSAALDHRVMTAFEVPTFSVGGMRSAHPGAADALRVSIPGLLCGEGTHPRGLVPEFRDSGRSDRSGVDTTQSTPAGSRALSSSRAVTFPRSSEVIRWPRHRFEGVAMTELPPDALSGHQCGCGVPCEERRCGICCPLVSAGSLREPQDL